MTETSRETKPSLWWPLAAVALTVASGAAGITLARALRQPTTAPPASVNGAEAAAPAKFPGRVFQGWKDPDLVLVLTGQMQGYLLPCGCSKPQVGGLERRYNLLQLVKAAGWPYVAVDLGNLAQKEAPAKLPNQQGLVKYIYTMRALKEMDYRAVSFGLTEVNLGLTTVLDNYALNDPKPRVVAGNLIGAKDNFPLTNEEWEPIDTGKVGITVGVTGVVSPVVATEIKELTRNDQRLRFERTPDALDRILKDMAAKKVQLPVLLYQGPVTKNDGKKPYTEAMACAEAYPQFPVIVTLSEHDDPSDRPVVVPTSAGTKTMLVQLGKKGKYVGVVGVWKTGKADAPFEYRYERVELTEDFLTAPHKEKGHPLMELMETYAKELKDRNYLGKYGQIRHKLQFLPPVNGLVNQVEVEYVGSDACKKCHEEAYEIWKKTPHSHAYKTLEDAKRPGLRNYDPECIVCHTVGFGYVSGYVDAATTPKLKDVGCESCHGPASVHVKNPRDTTWHERINPWKYLPANKREEATDQFCQQCHDQDNDVTWTHGGFKRKWPKIEHPTPK